MGLLKDFPLPQKVEVNESTATLTYCKFTAAPFQSGFGHTIGNSLRRILLSSLKEAAISGIRIDGVAHEFATIEHVVEDVSEIVLNLKKILLLSHSETPKTIEICKNSVGPVTAADIQTDGIVEIINSEQHICTIDKPINLKIELDVIKGRGYRAVSKNNDLQPIGTIPIDCFFSPVKRVKYQVGAARVGEKTEMDSLIVEIWTDGRISPKDALEQSSQILIEHLRPFLGKNDIIVPEALISDEEKHLFKILTQDIESMNLSVRSQNCLDSANIKIIGELCTKTEAKMLKYKNFGRKSLDEIITKLKSLNLDFGMNLSKSMNEAIRLKLEKVQLNNKEGDSK